MFWKEALRNTGSTKKFGGAFFSTVLSQLLEVTKKGAVKSYYILWDHMTVYRDSYRAQNKHKTYALD